LPLQAPLLLLLLLLLLLPLLRQRQLPRALEAAGVAEPPSVAGRGLLEPLAVVMGRAAAGRKALAHQHLAASVFEAAEAALRAAPLLLLPLSLLLLEAPLLALVLRLLPAPTLRWRLQAAVLLPPLLLLLLRPLHWLVRLLRLLLLLLPLLLLLLLRRPLLLRHARLLAGRRGGRRGPLAASVPAGHPEGQQALLGGQLAPQLPELRVRSLHERHDGAGAVLRGVVVALQELRPHHKLTAVQATRLQQAGHEALPPSIAPHTGQVQHRAPGGQSGAVLCDHHSRAAPVPKLHRELRGLGKRDEPILGGLWTIDPRHT
jgi:hypothetical protein